MPHESVGEGDRIMLIHEEEQEQKEEGTLYAECIRFFPSV